MSSFKHEGRLLEQCCFEFLTGYTVRRQSVSTNLYSWFSRDVTKILKSKPGGLQEFYFLLRKDIDYLKIHPYTIP